MVQLCTHSELWHSTLRIHSKMVAGLSGVIFSAKFRTRKQRRMAQAKCRVICRCDKRKAQPSVQLLVAGNQNQRDPTHTGNTTKEAAWQHAANRYCEKVFISKARDAPNKSKKKGCRERSKGKNKDYISGKEKQYNQAWPQVNGSGN